MRKFFVMFVICFLFGINSILAKSIVTTNGILIDEFKYEKLIDLYSESYINSLTQLEYNYLEMQDLSKIEVLEYNEVSSLREPTHSTDYKTIKLINANNKITLLLTWEKNPKIRSYDVLGVRFSGLTLVNNIIFKQTSYVNGRMIISSTGLSKRFSNGFGQSFLLSNGDNLESSLTFNVSGTGMIFGTYQHATSNISLEDSTSYSLSSSGLGSVLLFPDSIMPKYDAMSGVNMSIL